MVFNSAELVAGPINSSLSVSPKLTMVLGHKVGLCLGPAGKRFKNWLVKPNEVMVLIARVTFELNSTINASHTFWTDPAKI